MAMEKLIHANATQFRCFGGNSAITQASMQYENQWFQPSSSANFQIGLSSDRPSYAPAKLQFPIPLTAQMQPDLAYKQSSSGQVQKRKSGGALLSEAQAREIYKYKLLRVSSPGLKITATRVAKMYGMGEKTIRDIWTNRTWYRETLHLDPARDDAAERLSRQPGRPRAKIGPKTNTKEKASCRSKIHSPILPPSTDASQSIPTAVDEHGRQISVSDRADKTVPDGDHDGCKVSGMSEQVQWPVEKITFDPFQMLEALETSKRTNSSCGETDPFCDDWEF